MVRSYGFCPREIHFHSQGIHFLSWEILFNHKSTNLIMGSVPLKKRVLDIYLHARQIADFLGGDGDKIFGNFAHSKNYKNLQFSKLIHKSKPIKLYPLIDWKKCIYDIYKDTSLIAFIANGHSSVVERSTKNRLTKIFVGSKTPLSAEVFQQNETFFL